MPKKKSKWMLIEANSVTEYKCGVRAGERVQLLKDMVVRDRRGKPTGVVHRAGEIWFVTKGSAVPPLDVWLRQPDGHAHTWTDDNDFWAWFKRVDEEAG
jgi:hypothetical protein